jgi:hypothetical protein
MAGMAGECQAFGGHVGSFIGRDYWQVIGSYCGIASLMRAASREGENMVVGCYIISALVLTGKIEHGPTPYAKTFKIQGDF